MIYWPALFNCGPASSQRGDHDHTNVRPRRDLRRSASRRRTRASAALYRSRAPSPEPRCARLRAQRGAAMPVVMDADRISRALVRIAHEIVERNRGVEQPGRHRRALARRAAGPTHRRRAQADLRRRRAGGRARHHAVPRRPDAPDGRARSRSSAAPRFRSRSTTASSCWSTTCSSPAAPRAPRSTRSSTSAGREPSSSSCSSTAAIASCRSRPTTSARTSRRRAARTSTCGSPTPTAATKSRVESEG